MKYIDYFALPKFSVHDDQLYRARLLIGIIFAYLCVISLFAVFFAVAPGMSMSERFAGVLPTSAICFSFVGILHLLRTKGAYRFCAHAVITVTYIGIVAGVFITGGPLKTPTSTLLMLPVFLSFCLLERNDAYFWTLLVFIINIVAIGMSLQGFEFIMVTKPEMMDVTRGFNWVMAFLALVALMLVYEAMNSRLRTERDKEREKLQDVVNIAGGSNVVNQTAESLFSSSHNLIDSAIKQKTAVEQLSVTSEELGATSSKNVELAASAMQEIMNTEGNVNDSEAHISELLDAMQQVRGLSEEIKSINNVINEIAYQTNLLSLNAMIEASRFGDGNGGFKVVALEVKKLAERSAEAADNINRLLERNMLAVQKGAMTSEKIKSSFEGIAATVKPLSLTVRTVSDASYEQNEAIHQIVDGLMHINHEIEQNQKLADVTSTMAEKLHNNASSLSHAIALLENGR